MGPDSVALLAGVPILGTVKDVYDFRGWQQFSFHAMTRLLFVVLIFVVTTCSALADITELLGAALAARRRGDFDAAIKYYTLALSVGSLSNANMAVVLRSRGVVYDITGETDKAIADFNAAIQLKPDFGELLSNVGDGRDQAAAA
jgi:tetratricopeptide (TPR) repeat protein